MDRSTHVAKLKEDIAAGRLVTVAGTGVSVAACRNQKVEGFSVATWNGLLLHGVKHLTEIGQASGGLASLLRQQVGIGEVDIIIQAGETISSRMKAKSEGTFRGWLKGTVGELKVVDRELIDAVTALPGVVATLNYDNLLEECTGGQAVTWLRPDLVQDVLRGKMDNAVLHLHGWY